MMRTEYDMIYLTNLPSFYKVNLLNKIAEGQRLLVIFCGSLRSDRNSDFLGSDCRFDSISCGDKSLLGRLGIVIRQLCRPAGRHLVVTGWDRAEYFAATLLSRRRRNGVVVESSIFESTALGWKGLVKRIFLRRVSRAYVSGVYQRALVEALRFRGEIIVTRGVGIFNVVAQPPCERRSEVKRFLYVGRFIECKNLKYFIEIFNKFPDLTLELIGFGVQEDELRAIAGPNVVFLGAVNNRDLPRYYRRADVLVLPSVSETWGLVVEEALNNGTPVIVSDRVGCIGEVVVDGENGVIFSLADPAGAEKAIGRMLNVEFYNTLRQNIAQLDFEAIAGEQAACYTL